MRVYYGLIMNLVEALQGIGLNEKEAKVYVALLQLGRGRRIMLPNIAD